MRDRVTVGIPVYNGERYLADALRSVQQQSYTDLEIVISDNASTDATEEISRAAARTDPRIRYLRHDTNIGGRRNANLLVGEATTPYFKWAFYDDICGPDLVADCVAALEAEPTAVLVAPRVLSVAADGGVIEAYDDEWLGLDEPAPHARLRRLYITMGEQALFGVSRVDALRRTRLFPRRLADSILLLTELCLLGPIPQTRSQEMRIRHHDQRHGAARSSQFRWLGETRRRDRVFAYTRVTAELLRVVDRAPLDPEEKRRCRAVVLRHWTLRTWRSTLSDVRFLAQDLRSPG